MANLSDSLTGVKQVGIRYSVSQWFHNKENRAPERTNKHTGELSNLYALGAFKTIQSDPDTLASHITSGNAISVGALSKNWRNKANFESAQIMGVDFDHGPDVDGLIAKPLIRDHAFLVYRTPSWTPEAPRTRAIFILDISITDLKEYERFVKRLFRQFAIEDIDEMCKDGVRIFYGSTQPGAIVNTENRLPLEVLRGMPPHPDELPKPPPAPRMIVTPENAPRAEKYALAAREGIISEALSAPAGTGLRHAAFNAMTMKLIARADWPCFEGIESEIESIGRQMGRDDNEIERSIHGAKAKAERLPFSLPAVTRPRRQKLTRPVPRFDTIQPDILLNQQYVELPSNPKQRCIAVQSDVGTGKTQAAIRLMKSSPNKAYFLTHREKLAGNFSESAAAAGVPVEHYKTVERRDWRRVKNLSICINSYAAMAKDNQGLPLPELLVIDEIDQVIEHIFGNAGTFDNENEAILAGETLCFLIKNVKQLIVMDAHLSDITLDCLKRLRGAEDVLYIRNEYTAQRGALTMYDRQEVAIAAGKRLIDANEGVVVFAIASEKRAEAISHDLIRQLGSAEDVLLVTAQTADQERQSDFLKHTNVEISKYRAVVHSPVIGTGFDVTAPVRAVVGVMGAFLSGYDARQMVGRCRNADELHIWLPETSGDLEENPEAIYQSLLEKSQRTCSKLNADGFAVPDIPQSQIDYLQTHARVMARKNASINRLRAHFIELSKGYNPIAWNIDSDHVLKAEIKAQLKAIEDARKALALTVQAVDKEAFEKLRDAGRADDTATAGFMRWKIETVSGLIINPEVRNKLWTSNQRQALRAYTDLIDDTAQVNLADAQEINRGVPIPKLKHRAIKRQIRWAFLKPLLTPNGEPIRYTKEALEAVYAPIIAQHGNDLKRFFAWRPDRCKSAASIVRLVLKSCGLKLDSEQSTVNGKKERHYQLDRDALRDMRYLGNARLTMLQADRLTSEDSNLKSAIAGVTTPNGSFKIDSPPPETPEDKYLKQARAGGNVNPFAKERAAYAEANI